MGYFALTALNGVIFVAWAVMLFRTLFAQRRRVAARTGKMFPGVADALAEWQRWWRSPDMTVQRRLLIGLTVALLISLALLAIATPTSR